MIRVRVTRAEQEQGITCVVKKLRAAGIPVRQSGEQIRLCPEWDASPEGFEESDRIIGHGRLDWMEYKSTGTVEFVYQPPARKDVIDVDARIIEDVPRLKGNT